MATQPPYRALLARLERDRVHHEECAALSRIDEGRIAHSAMAAGFHLAAGCTVEVFEGAEAAGEYMQRTAASAGESGPNPTPGFVNPPGSTAEQLPADVLELIDPAPYLSTACGTAQALEAAVAEHPQRRASLLEWAGRLHQRCRENQKFTGQDCVCPCREAAP